MVDRLVLPRVDARRLEVNDVCDRDDFELDLWLSVEQTHAFEILTRPDRHRERDRQIDLVRASSLDESIST
jgi:hypothetical protein